MDRMEIKDAQGSRPRKLSYIENEYDMEDIVLKPSTELIPDEYEHYDNEKALVHIFRGEYKHDALNTERFMDCFAKLRYNISLNDNVHFIKRKEDVYRDLRNIATEAKNKSCLIILFLDLYDGEDKLVLHEEPNDYLETKDIWIHFTSYKLPELKGIPKIFIFQATKRIKTNVTNDSFVAPDRTTWYEIPGEADMLLVYKKIDPDNSDSYSFIHDFCQNVEKNGERDDVISLMTMSDESNGCRQIMVSTLTKKFYFTSSRYRGHYLDLHANHTRLLKTLADVTSKIAELENKRLQQARNSPIRKISSFRQQMKAPSSSEVVADVVDNAKRSTTSSATRKVSKANTTKSSTTERPRWRY